MIGITKRLETVGRLPRRGSAGWERVVTVAALVFGMACSKADVAGEMQTIGGRVHAEDGQVGVPCKVEINSLESPFYAPVSIELRTGDELKHGMKVGEPIDDVYVAIRCEGYATLTTRPFDLKRAQDVDLGRLVVSKERKGPE